jgi:hypothetical protein
MSSLLALNLSFEFIGAGLVGVGLVDVGLVDVGLIGFALSIL